MRKKHRIILIVVVGVLLAVLACLPKLIGPRSSKSACLSTLEFVHQIKATWALDNRKANSDTPSETDLFGSTNYAVDMQMCPAGARYILGRVNQRPRCLFPGHEVFLACAEVVDESGQPLAGVRVEGPAGSSWMLRGKTDRQGCIELNTVYDSDAENWPHGTNRLVVTKRGYRTEKLPIPDMWPLRVVLKREDK